jgi:hypothetical protein
MDMITRSFLGLILSLAALAPLGTAAQTMPTSPSYQGLWWNSPDNSEPGWGINITHQGNILFATWFTYDADGNPTWFFMSEGDLQPAAMNDDPYGYGYGYPGMMTSSNYEYSGALFSTRGSAFNAPAFDASALSVQPVGDADFMFTDANHATFSYTVNGVRQSKSITRDNFSTPPTCTFGGDPSLNFQDLWWRAPGGSEKGWGLTIAHQGDTIFAAWFTYDTSGKPMWFFMPGLARTTGNTFTGGIFRASGPAFSVATWDASKVKTTQMGTATLAFSDATNGTFTTVMNGATISKAITRQVFATPVTVCR